LENFMGSPLFLRADVLIDGDSPLPIRDAAVRVDSDGLIAKVGPASLFGSEIELAERVPAVMPGLIDCHAHVTLPANGRGILEQLRVGDARLAVTAVSQSLRHLHAGYTTVRDCGARAAVAFDVRDGFQESDVDVPHLLVCGRAITRSGGHLSWCGSTADTEDEIREQVQILARDGADAIKIIASGGSTGGDAFRASYAAEKLQAAVRASHELGLATVAHCRSTDSILNSARAGIDVIAHLEFLTAGQIVDLGGGAPTGIPQYDPQVAEAVAASGAWLDLNPQSSGWDTVEVLRQLDVEDGLAEAQKLQLAGLERYFEGMLGVISHLRELDLVERMAFGSDAGPYDTEFGRADLNVELARLSGLSPMESLQVITRNAARLCGIADDVGAIRPGLKADLLVLDENPLQSPKAIRSVAAVYRSGRRMVKNGR
jgi:imidazolonepropionase-like amidohydrolase